MACFRVSTDTSLQRAEKRPMSSADGDGQKDDSRISRA